MGQDFVATQAIIAAILMFGVLVISIIPLVPGPLLLWGIVLMYAIIEDFEKVTALSFGIITILMVLGTTTDWWLRPLGLRSEGGSCLTTIGSLVGGLLGTFLIPIPILGSIIGAIVGAIVVEYLRRRNMQEALHAGGTTFKMILIGKGVEYIFSVMIFAVYIVSVFVMD